MKSTPINYSPEMILARKAGRKTQTRRIILQQFHGQPMLSERNPRQWSWFGENTECYGVLDCPYGCLGDRLWIREEHRILAFDAELAQARVEYRADNEERIMDLTAVDMQRIQARKTPLTTWMRARFMLRSLSRAEDEIVKVRVQRLQDISEADALAEGIEVFDKDALLYRHFGERLAESNQDDPRLGMVFSAQESFETLWQAIHGPDSWAANPFVWAITFKPVTTHP